VDSREDKWAYWPIWPAYIGIIWFYDPGKMDDANLLEIRWIDGRNPAR
jgi:hypothetical protein